MKMSREVFIVGGLRTPFMKSSTKYMGISNQEMMTEVLKQMKDRYHLKHVLGDVALGGVMNSSSRWNLARECVLGAGLNAQTPAYNVQRACGTSLETVNHMALKIASGQIEDGIGAGVDTNSDVPIEVNEDYKDFLLHLNNAKSIGERLKLIAQIRPHFLKPSLPMVVEPRTKMSMGQHTEKMVKEWKISREDQDLLAYRSHQNGEKAYQDGFYTDLVFEYHGLKKDGPLRGDTSVEKLAKLKPAFDRQSGNGTLTAGNSSPLTDGAAAVLLASEEACKKHDWKPLARFVDCQAAAVDYVAGAGLLMAPTIAVSQLLARNNLSLQDFDFYEIHEAFTGQVLCTLKAWEDPTYCRDVLGRSQAMGSIDTSKMNIKGGSVALGHPFGATGARIVASLAKTISTAGRGRGLISICTAGGMGVAAIVEAV